MYFQINLLFFFSSVLLVYFSETINEIAAIHWKSFSRQQYFDSNGLFIATVFSIPILLNCMLMIVRTHSKDLEDGFEINKYINSFICFRVIGCTIQRNLCLS